MDNFKKLTLLFITKFCLFRFILSIIGAIFAGIFIPFNYSHGEEILSIFMVIMYPVLLLLSGLLVLYIGAEALVRGSSRLAHRFHVPPLIIGLTIVAFGTSAPELVVSIHAALEGSGDLALGNVIGSNIMNIAVILGLSALIRPLKVQLKVVRVDVPIMIAVSALLYPFLLKGKTISRLEGALLVAGIITYTVFNIVMALRQNSTEDTSIENKQPHANQAAKELILIVLGLGMLVSGSRLFVSGAVSVARILKVSEAVIGLTIVAIGTSLPELASSVVAAIRKEADIAIGNIVGSNIFNILCILGFAGIIAPLKAVGITFIDIHIMMAVSVLLLPFVWSGFVLSRFEGLLLLIIYAGYTWYLWPK